MAEEKRDVKMQAPDGKMRETDAANLERENLMSNVPKLRFPEFRGEWEEKCYLISHCFLKEKE